VSDLSEARDAAIRRVAWHDGRQAAAAADLRQWMREYWPTVVEGQRVDAVVWNSMPDTLAKIAEGEGLAAAITRSVREHLLREGE
jgi:hypothetical protein